MRKILLILLILLFIPTLSRADYKYNSFLSKNLDYYYDPFSTSIDDTEMTAESFGDFTCDGTEDGCTVTDFTITSEAGGDILYFNGTNWIRLGKGTAGQALQMNVGATAPEWGSAGSGDITAVGDCASGDCSDSTISALNFGSINLLANALTITKAITSDTLTVDTLTVNDTATVDTLTVDTLRVNTFNAKLNSGYLFVGNSSNISTGVAMTGDTIIDSSGSTTIATNSHSHPLNQITSGTYSELNSIINDADLYAVVDPNADRIPFWDDSASTITWLIPNTNLSISGTYLNALASDVTCDTLTVYDTATIDSLVVTQGTFDTLNVGDTATIDSLVITKGVTCDTLYVNKTATIDSLTIIQSISCDTLTINDMTTANALTTDTLYVNKSATVDTLTVDTLIVSTEMEIPYSGVDATLIDAGKIHLNIADDQLNIHWGTGGEITGEASISGLRHLTVPLDPSGWYDHETTYRVFPLFYVGDDSPEGITITEWKMDYAGGDPTTELDCDLCCDTTPDFNPADNMTVMDVLDTDAGTSSADTGFDSATCANGSRVYLRFGADPTDDNVVVAFDLWFYNEED